MEVELPFGIESAVREVTKVKPTAWVQMSVCRGVVQQVEVVLTTAEAAQLQGTLRKAGFTTTPDSPNRFVWSRYGTQDRDRSWRPRS